MTDLPPDPQLLRLLPEELVGTVERIAPVSQGLSGAGVYAITTSSGQHVLRIQPRSTDPTTFAEQLRIIRCAAAAGIAPDIVHVDEGEFAVVSLRVPARPIGEALADPTQRGAFLGSIVERLRSLHAIDPAGLTERDPLAYARASWQDARERPGFPAWAAALAPTFAGIAAVLDRDPRRVLCHNDLNPSNVLWDGSRTWLIDWEMAGVGHPYYDVAVLALFLRMTEESALELVTAHDGMPPDERSRASLTALRQLAGLLTGLTFLGLVGDLTRYPAPQHDACPSLDSCYQAMRTGELDLQEPQGQWSMGIALLAEGVGAAG